MENENCGNSETNPLKIVDYHLAGAAKRLKLGKIETDYLLAIDRELSFTISIDSGELLFAYVVQHDFNLSPVKGGTRFDKKNVTFDEVRGLAKTMTCKNPLHDLLFGGMKAGVVCDPRNRTLKELKEISEKFMAGAAPILGEEIAVLGPDAGVTAQMMGWMMKKYSALKGVPNIWGIVTGKPVELRGSEGRKDATGIGGAVVILEALKKIGMDSRNCKVISEGFGNVNIPAVKILHKAGVKIIGLSDSRSAIFNENGFSESQLRKAIELKENGRKPLAEVTDGKEITHDDLFSRECDIFISAAVGTTITAQRAGLIKAKIVAELGNICATIEADEIFRSKKITVLADVMASGGGVKVSGYEMEQNKKMEQWPEKVVVAKLQKHMKGVFEKCWEYSQENKLYLRDAAWDLGMKRVADARRCAIC